jgi:class 3 adenylate cyclase/tetratricopeptide (TPR) repeat protein
MRCPKCQHENPDDARFCNGCGNRLELICPECGKINPPGSRFCNACGRDLQAPEEATPVNYNQPQSYTPKFLADKILTKRSSIEGERKLVTVLFADVADYTSLAEKVDPEEVHQIMDGCFQIMMDEIHRYEGTVNQFTGDGVMALFGAPIAREDHAQRACYAALSIQKRLSAYGAKVKEETGLDFRMRIGLNSGPVIVGSIGDDLRMDYTAVGDTTNLASRMESLAGPGSVFVSRNTKRLAGAYFEFKSLGDLEVKGKAEPQEAFALIKAGEVTTRIEASAAKGLTRFVGRKNSMAALMEAYDKAKTGSGQVVGMVGEAGVGKSRLLLEFRNRGAQDELTYLEGRCLHYGSAMPYLPILDVLKSYFEIEEGDREFVIRKKLVEKIFELDEALEKELPSFQDLLSLKVEDPEYQKLEPKAKKERAFEAIRNLLVRESQRKTTVLAIDDLHWMDKTSEAFLDYLIGWLANSRVLLVLLYRPEYTHQWGSKSYYTHIGLDQLTMKSSAELVQSILEGGEVVPELRELILNRAAGNPLFMEELTHSLLENGSIKREHHQYVLAKKASEIEVPDTVQGIIAARIDRVEENLKRIMQVASVIGREFAYRILQTIMGMREDLKSSLLNLQGLEFIYEKRLFPELEYIFKHALTQEVAYNSLLLNRRKEIHEKIGNAIEELYPDRIGEYYELLGYHYMHSDNMEKAVEYLSLACEKAVRVSAMEDALAYFEEAMKLLDTLPETELNRQRRISLLANQGPMFMLLFKTQEYYELLIRYEPMAIDLGNQRLRGAFYAGKGWCEWWFGYFDQSVQSASKAAELSETTGDAERAGWAYELLQWNHVCKGDFYQAITVKGDVDRMIEQQFNLRTSVYAFCAAVWAYTFLGRWDEAVEEGQAALRVAEKFSDRGLVSFAASSISMTYCSKGDLVQAVKYGELAVERALTPAEKFWAQGFLAWAWSRAGEAPRGIELLPGIVSAHRVGRFKFGEIGFIGCLGEAYFVAGEYDKAAQTLQEGLKLAENCGLRFWVVRSQRLLSEVMLKINPHQVKEPLAAPYFEESIAISHEIKAENELALAYAGYGRLHWGQGKIAQAREYLTKALEIFERLGTLQEPDRVREALAQLPGV